MTVVVLPSLPAPGGSQQEVLFRRMLLQCSRRINHPLSLSTTQQEGASSSSSSSNKDWRTDAKFHCIVDTLQERLYDLEHAGPEVRPGPDVLQQYQAAVRAIATQLQQPQLPTYCLRVTAQDRLPATSEATAAAATTTASGKGHQTAGSSDKQSALSTRGASDKQQQQQAGNNTPAAGSRGARRGSSGAAAAAAGGADEAAASSADGDAPPNFSLSSRTRDMLTTQQRLQDELTDELLDMGQELKSSTLAMQNAIRYRGKLLDETEVSLVNSAENAKAVAAKAKEQYRQGNWNLCHTCIIVLSVFVIFTVMLVVIRVSSMVGLKGS